MAISSGSYTIGTGEDYSLIESFGSDIDSSLTGDLTGYHVNEETNSTTGGAFVTDTGSYLLKLTAQAGAEHDGTYSGARVAYTTFDSISLNSGVVTKLDNVEVSNLCIKMANNCEGIDVIEAGGGGGQCLINRNIVNCGGATNTYGIRLRALAENCLVTNNIVFSGSLGVGIGLHLYGNGSNSVHSLYNNTFVKMVQGVRQDAGTLNGTIYLKNNLCQGNTTDYVDDGGGYTATSKNISEDATSPDTSYRSINAHDGTSSFVDYTNHNYLLTSGGDDNATLDDGDDLSGTFTDDIIGQTRSTWYIGASELITAGGVEWKPSTEMYVNVGDVWKPVNEKLVNVGDVWKPVSEVLTALT